MNEPIKTKTQLAAELNVSRSTIYAWIERDILPDTGPWDLSECKQAVEQYAEELEEQGLSTELKERKLELECQRLVVSIQREKELLKQSRIETDRQSGKLMDYAEGYRNFRWAMDRIRAACDNWHGHTIAVHPAQADFVDELRSTLFTAIVNAVESLPEPPQPKQEKN